MQHKPSIVERLRRAQLQDDTPDALEAKRAFWDAEAKRAKRHLLIANCIGYSTLLFLAFALLFILYNYGDLLIVLATTGGAR